MWVWLYLLGAEGETTCHAPELENFRCVKKCDQGNDRSEILNTCFGKL